MTATLRMKGIEGQGRLSRAADAGDDRELVARQDNLHVLEIVGAGAFDVDGRVQRGEPYLGTPKGEVRSRGGCLPLISPLSFHFYLKP